MSFRLHHEQPAPSVKPTEVVQVLSNDVKVLQAQILSLQAQLVQAKAQPAQPAPVQVNRAVIPPISLAVPGPSKVTSSPAASPRKYF